MRTALLFTFLVAAQPLQPAAPAAHIQVAASAPAVPKSFGDTREYIDPEGTYSGMTICADCSGIGVRLTLTDARGFGDHGTYVRRQLYIDVPVNGYRGPNRDQTDFERGTWKLYPALAGEAGPKLCLLPTGVHPGSKQATHLDCYHLVHQTELVFVTGFEEDGTPNPFPSAFNTLLKVRRLHDGHEYPLLPVDGR